MTAYAPEAHLASAIINWAPYYIKATKEALDGTWATGSVWWGVKEGAIDIVSINAMVPAETQEMVAKVKAGLKDGSFVIWQGPIVGQDGKEVLKQNEVADDKFLGGVNFYVKGVDGKVPSGNKKWTKCAGIPVELSCRGAHRGATRCALRPFRRRLEADMLCRA